MHHATTAKLFQQKRAKREAEAREREEDARLLPARLKDHERLHQEGRPYASLCSKVGCPHAPKTSVRYTYDPEAVRLTMNGTTITLGEFNRGTLEAALGHFDRTYGARRKG